MRTVKLHTLILLASTLGVSAAAANFDGTGSLICSLGHVIECDYGMKCQTVTNENVNAPDFLKLDFKKREFVASTAGVSGDADDIDNVVDLENHLIVQGVQGTSANDALGWSMSIDQVTGQMVLTGSGNNAGFVIHGACTPL